MLKQLLSVSDVKQLKTGDRLSDQPDFSLGKVYTIENISRGLVYAIYDNIYCELKVFTTDEVPQICWWVSVPDEDRGHLVFPT
jgi:hypothetical protein